ncbi:unnamed protein product [Parajaminaea phylloscopi]
MSVHTEPASSSGPASNRRSPADRAKVDLAASTQGHAGRPYWDHAAPLSRASTSSSSSSSSWEFETEPTASLLHKDSAAHGDSVHLKKMFRTPTLKRSHSSKRIIHRDSDDEDEDVQDPPSPSTRHSRVVSSHSRRSFRRSLSRPNDIGESAQEGEPLWMANFDDRRNAKENKSLAVSAELDAMGMGKYQWFIFYLCGLGFFVDLLWAQAFGLITVPLPLEDGFGAEKSNIGTLSTAFNVGLTVGAFSWGIGVDVVGRRLSFYLTCLISGIFGISSGAAPNFTALRVLVAFIGFGVGGNIPIDCTITLEFLPTHRHYLLAMLSIFQPIGTLVASGIAYAFIPKYSCGGENVAEVDASSTNCPRDANMGWRYTLHTIGAITLFVFFVRFAIFKFRESPAYLINRGKDEQALTVLKQIAKVNGAPEPQLSMKIFQEIEQRCRELKSMSTLTATDSDHGDDGVVKGTASVHSHQEVRAGQTSASAASAGQGNVVAAGDSEKTEETESVTQTLRRALSDLGAQLRTAKILFRDRKMARITILLWLTYMADFFGFNIAGVFLPLILSDRGAEAGQSLSDTYRDYVAIYAPGIAACLLACALIEVPRVGRQWVMVISSALMGVSMFVYTVVHTQAQSVGLNAMEYFFQSLFNAVLYCVTPELYPSSIRGTASGLTSTLGRIAGIIAPLAGQSLYGAAGAGADGAAKTLYLGGAVTLICPIALMLLPYDTRGRRSY